MNKRYASCCAPPSRPRDLGRRRRRRILLLALETGAKNAIAAAAFLYHLPVTVLSRGEGSEDRLLLFGHRRTYDVHALPPTP